jgi:TIR domain
MKVFLSHASVDGAIAAYLKARFEDVGVATFMLPDDAPPGSRWMEQIREGLNNADELVTLATPAALTRPWIAAEWACFWLRDLRTTPLLVNTKVSDLWEPMNASQAVDLLDPSQTMNLFNRFAGVTKVQPTAGVLPLARDVAKQVPEIIVRARQANVADVIARLAINMQAGTDNIQEADVLAAIAADRVHDVVKLATEDRASAVKQRQVAAALVRAGRPGEAFDIAINIHNRNEIKNVVFAVLEVTHPHLGEESEEWRFLTRIYDYLGEPQRRNVRQRMLDTGLYPRDPWLDQAEISPS